MISEPENLSYASYIRASTDQQRMEHQRNSIDDWMQERGLSYADCDQYVDYAKSGSDPGREDFEALVDAINNDRYDVVVVWELSRLARLGTIYSRFLEQAADNDTTIAITDDIVDEVKPDGSGKLMADIAAAIYEEERRRLIRRIEAGREAAIRNGVYSWRPPAGFRVRDGTLEPILHRDPELDEESKDTYLDIRKAIQQVDDGASLRSVANDLQMSRPALSTIYNDNERRRWYLEATATVPAEEDSIKEEKVARRSHIDAALTEVKSAVATSGIKTIENH